MVNSADLRIQFSDRKDLQINHISLGILLFRYHSDIETISCKFDRFYSLQLKFSKEIMNYY